MQNVVKYFTIKNLVKCFTKSHSHPPPPPGPIKRLDWCSRQLMAGADDPVAKTSSLVVGANNLVTSETSLVTGDNN